MTERINLAAIRARAEDPFIPADAADIAALCDEVERLCAENAEIRAAATDLIAAGDKLRASNERLRHVVELDEAIYLDLARAAGFDHEPPSDARACIAAVKAMATERDALRTELDDARNVALGLTEDCAAMREILAGRDRAPTPEEVAAHAKHGRWRAALPGGRIFTARYPGETERHWRGARWWAIDETETPCAWPVVAP